MPNTSIGRKVLQGIRHNMQSLKFALTDVIIKTDGAGWILDYFTREIVENLSPHLRIKECQSKIISTKNRVIHFVTFECWRSKWPGRYDRSNTMIGLWWHGGLDSISLDVKKFASYVKPNSEFMAKVHVTCSISQNQVREMGVADEKIVFLPMGINLTQFSPAKSASERQVFRRQLGIPEDVLVIGLFQKDGTGWEDGNEPKLIKGPDIFVDAMTRLAEKFPVFALIPGPARGYVIQGLEKAGIPYRNDGHVPYTQILPYYQAADLYIIPGREEGGPAAVLESLAAGTPLVSHRVGMAPDVISDGQNGFLVEVGDVDGMVQKASRLLESQALRDEFRHEGLKTVKRYDWRVVAKQYGEFYSSFL